MDIRVVARVLIQNDKGELLLCRNRSGKALVPPGGTLEPGETIAEAAVREAEEEAGLTVQLGPLLWVREFRPADRHEHVVETYFLATAVSPRPDERHAGERRLAAAGPETEPWRAWYIQDVDGPRREVRWYSREELAATPLPIFPELIRRSVWAARTGSNPYLGLAEA